MIGYFETPQRVWAMAGVPGTAEGPTYILFLRVVSFNVVNGFLASSTGESPAPPLVPWASRVSEVSVSTNWRQTPNNKPRLPASVRFVKFFNNFAPGERSAV
jgi:hypothetical protein